MSLFKKRHQHYWKETGVPGDLVFMNGKFVYECLICDKRKSFRYAPVNPILETNQQYYQRMVASGRASLVMYPALGTFNEPHIEPLTKQ